MELYLIRHADAAPVGQNGVLDDALRPLTPKGQEQSKAVGHGLVRRGVRLPMVVASPLLRARQTAEGIAQALAEPGLELRTCEELAPGGKRKRLRRFLKDLSLDAVALVGHESLFVLERSHILVDFREMLGELRFALAEILACGGNNRRRQAQSSRNF